MTDETTYSTALDTVSHAAEAYFSKKCGEIERLFAVKALKTVKKALNNFRNNEKSENIRRELYIASLYAGMAINGSGTSLAHSMGYQLTSYKGVPHGAACAVFLTEFLSRMSESDEFFKDSGFKLSLIQI